MTFRRVVYLQFEIKGARHVFGFSQDVELVSHYVNGEDRTNEGKIAGDAIVALEERGVNFQEAVGLEFSRAYRAIQPEQRAQ